MQKYKSNLTSVSGAAVRGASITVLDESGAVASIFLDRAGTLPAGNPLKTAQDGTFEFYAANARYSLRTDSSGLNVLEEDVILLFDPDESPVENVNKAILTFPTFGAAQAAAATLPDGQEVESPDAAGRTTRYEVQSGVLVFIRYLTRPTEIVLSDVGMRTDGVGNAALVLSTIAECLSVGAELVIDSMFTLREPIILTQAHNGLRTRASGAQCGFRWADGLSFTAGQNYGLLTLAPTGVMQDVYICPLSYDGNKAGVTASSDNTVHGVSVLDLSGGNFVNIVIDSPVAYNNRGSGISCRNGGVDIRFPKAFGNTWHGAGVAYSANSSGIAYFTNPECFDNGAYGFDASSGSTIVEGDILTYRNGQGGSKTSEGCLLFSAGSITARDNKAFGFRTTGTATDLVLNIGKMDIRGTVTDGTGNLGQSIGISTGKQINIGNIVTDGASGDADVDIRIGGATSIAIGSITSSNAKNRSVYLTAAVGNVGSITTNKSGKLGLLVDAASNIAVTGKVSCTDPNRLGNTGNDQYSVVVLGASTLSVAGGVAMVSTVASATATKGMNASAASQVAISGGLRASGILEADVLNTSGAGTTLKVSGPVTGLRMETKETILASGDGTTTAFTLTLANPLASIGGGFYTAEVYGDNNATNTYGFSVYQVSATLVRVRFTNPPAAGTNNLSFTLRVKCDVYR